MNCSSCNAQIPDGNTFCHQCGAQIETVSEPQPEKSSSSKTWIWVTGIGVGLLVALKLFGKVVFSHYLIGFLVLLKRAFRGDWVTVVVVVSILAMVCIFFAFRKQIFGLFSRA